MDLSQIQAQRVISALKRGVFPPVKVEYFTAGRSTEIASLKRDLSRAASGGSSAAFFEGDYGHGKSHMLRTVQSIAVEAGFAVAWVTIDGRTHAFNHPTRYLHAFLENLVVPNLPTRGLANAVDAWMTGPRRSELLGFAKTAPWPIGMSLLRIGQTSERQEEVDLSSGWFLEGRDLQAKNGIHYHDLFYERVEAIGQLCRAAGLKGMVWLFDEVECISKFLVNRLSRFAAYSVMKRLVEPTGFQHSCFYFATTSEFRDRLSVEYTPYGMYGGAAAFVADWRAAKYPIHRLKKLNREDNNSLLRSIRDAHAIAYEWQATDKVGDHVIAKYLDMADGKVMTEREIVRAFVNILEICEQNPGLEPMHKIGRST